MIGSGSILELKVVMVNNLGIEYFNLDSILVSGNGIIDGGDIGGDFDNGGEFLNEFFFLSGICFNCFDLEVVNLVSDFVVFDYYVVFDIVIVNGESV